MLVEVSSASQLRSCDSAGWGALHYAAAASASSSLSSKEVGWTCAATSASAVGGEAAGLSALSIMTMLLERNVPVNELTHVRLVAFAI